MFTAINLISKSPPRLSAATKNKGKICTESRDFRELWAELSREGDMREDRETRFGKKAFWA